MKIEEVNQLVSEILEQDELLEMANLNPKATGFSHYIWVGKPSPKHSHRVKVVNEPGRIDPANSFSISISDDPKVVAGKSEIPQRELNKIIAWIKINKEVLIQHAKLEIDDDELKARLKKVEIQEGFTLIEEELLFEMAMNLRQSDTGLPFVIWVSTKEAYGKDINHGPRIKVMNSKDQKAKRQFMYSIDAHPPYTVRRPHGMVIKSKDLKVAKDWIIKNNEALVQYWEDEISVPEFLEKIKKREGN